MANCCPCPGHCGCSTVPNQWKFSVAGVANGGIQCDLCAGFNGDWVLTFDPSFNEYTWLAPNNTNPCIVTQPAWRLECVYLGGTDPFYTLSIGNSGNTVVDQWRLPGGVFKCLQANIMIHDIAGDANGCDASAVGNITLTPI